MTAQSAQSAQSTQSAQCFKVSYKKYVIGVCIGFTCYILLEWYSSDQICERYRSEGNMKHIFQSNIDRSNTTAVDFNDLTLVTQFNVERLPDFERLIKHWPGPMSVAVYGTNETSLELQIDSNPVISARGNIRYHVVQRIEEFYPVNFLRNLAKDGAITKYVYLSDIDLLPCFGCYEKLKDYANNLLKEKQVFVVPAFDFTASERKDFPPYPHNKTELLKLWQQGKAEMFYSSWPSGHGPTNFTKWKTADAPYKIDYAEMFEPYVVMEKAGSPMYEEGFLGRIRDKISFFLHLDVLNYSFFTLPDVFTIHQPHPKVLKVAYVKCGHEHYEVIKKKLRSTRM